VNCLSYQKINKFDRLFSEILANISAPTYVGHPVYSKQQWAQWTALLESHARPERHVSEGVGGVLVNIGYRV
jgi:hypothetical protein